MSQKVIKNENEPNDNDIHCLITAFKILRSMVNKAKFWSGQDMANDSENLDFKTSLPNIISYIKGTLLQRIEYLQKHPCKELSEVNTLIIEENFTEDFHIPQEEKEDTNIDIQPFKNVSKISEIEDERMEEH